MTGDEWLDIAALWARIWPHRPLLPESVEPWFMLLEDLDGHRVRQALLEWAADPDRSWPPQSPGELRGQVEAGGETWPEAAARLADLVRRFPVYEGISAPTPDLSDDPVLAGYVASMGGWGRVARSVDVADPTWRAQFRDVHGQLSRRRQQTHVAQIAAGHPLGQLTEGGG